MHGLAADGTYESRAGAAPKITYNQVSARACVCMRASACKQKRVCARAASGRARLCVCTHTSLPLQGPECPPCAQDIEDYLQGFCESEYMTYM